MTAAFTPGPWYFSNEGANCLMLRADAAGSGYYSGIGSITQRDPHPRLGSGISAATCQANAELIASAPDLLAECDWLKAANAELAEALDSMVANFDYDGEIPRELRALERARAALAKHRALNPKPKGETQ